MDAFSRAFVSDLLKASGMPYQTYRYYSPTLHYSGTEALVPLEHRNMTYSSIKPLSTSTLSEGHIRPFNKPFRIKMPMSGTAGA
jgi:hypothetical protein